MPTVDLSTHPVDVTQYGRWQRLNRQLGIESFGANAVVCDPGELAIEHDESDTGQQEMYIVIAGSARFTIGDEVVEAGPGTIVAAPDPGVTREYEALEPGTRIICIGAAPSVYDTDYGNWILRAAQE